ncbi:MAG: hypothetical protein ACI4PF_02215 [Christensenellales bacterium]
MKLNTRQWNTYNLIKSNTLKGEITTQKDIIKNYPIEEHKDGYKYSPRKNTSDVCSDIWKDIEIINFSSEIEKIVVVHKYTYKLAENKEEANKYYLKLLSNACKKLRRAYVVLDKINENGQGKLLSTKDKPIDDNSSARDYCEAFIKKMYKEADNDTKAHESTINQ